MLGLSRDGRSGSIQTTVRDASFDVPTTVALFKGRLYLPNARFGTPSPATADYQVVSVPRP